MPRYRRIPLTREKSLQAALASVLVGAGTAAVTYVIARLMLQRDPLLPTSLESGASSDRALGPGARSESAVAASGADTEAE